MLNSDNIGQHSWHLKRILQHSRMPNILVENYCYNKIEGRKKNVFLFSKMTPCSHLLCLYIGSVVFFPFEEVKLCDFTVKLISGKKTGDNILRTTTHILAQHKGLHVFLLHIPLYYGNAAVLQKWHLGKSHVTTVDTEECSSENNICNIFSPKCRLKDIWQHCQSNAKKT